MKKYIKSQMLINKHKGESKMEINKSICPLCGKHNNCGYENVLTHNGCWCEKIEVPKELREMIPENLRGKACICKECVIKYKEKNKK